MLDAKPDLVSNRSHGGDIASGGVVELPVLVALAWEQRASIAASHRDDDVGSAHDLVGPWLRKLVGDINSDLGHGGYCRRVDLIGRFRPAGIDGDPIAREMAQPACG